MSNPIASRESIFWLDAAPDSPALGGKARMLARLVAAGLLVPPGFVLSAELLPPDPPDGWTYAPAARPPLPQAAVQALAGAYADLGQRLGEGNPRVAVRSSGLAEDLAQASFAGQYVSVLGVRGLPDVLAAAGRCWASLWSPEVAAYRAAVTQRTGQPLPAPGMAVLVQALVPADAAGVVETLDSLRDQRDTLVIHAAWGLGRSVVEGAVEPDTFHVARDTGAVIELHVGDKRTRSGLGLAPQPEPVAAGLQRRSCLTLDEAAEVAALALRAEAIVREMYPATGSADVEWALADGRVWLLQARPLVRPPAAVAGPAEPAPTGGPTPTFPFEWPDDDTAARHWRQGAGENGDARVFEALTPFELDVRALNQRSSLEAMHITGAPETMQCLEVNGYLYYAPLPNPLGASARALREETYLRPVRALHARGDTLLGTVLEPEAEETVRRLAAVDPDAMDAESLAAHFDETWRWYDRAWVMHMMMDPWDDTSPAGRAGKLYREITGDTNPWALFAAFGHIPQKGHLVVDGLLDLAELAQAAPALGSLFRSATPARILAGLATTEGGAAFQRRLDALIEDYGLQSGASQGVMRGQVMPGWREDPTLAIAIVQRYLPQDLAVLRATRRRSAEEYARVVQALRDKVAQTGASPERRAQFDFWFDALIRQVTSVVDHNHYLDGPMNALLHRALLACGRRLAAAGALAQAEDVWWLRAWQVPAAVRSLADPRLPAWQQLVAANKALHAWQRSLTPPAYLGAPPAEPPAASPPPGDKDAAPANLLVKGRGGAPGVATGRVRLIDYRLFVPEVQAGDVFVAHDCGVLWAAVLPIAAAVVLDGSNQGEHPMRICTEFGVPAIVRAGNATQVLREGQRVTVDGNRGWVLSAD